MRVLLHNIYVNKLQYNILKDAAPNKWMADSQNSNQLYLSRESYKRKCL